MPKTSQAQRDAVRRYDAANARNITVKLNRKTDADILSRLDRDGNITGYIKALIRADITKEEQ